MGMVKEDYGAERPSEFHGSMRAYGATSPTTFGDVDLAGRPPPAHASHSPPPPPHGHLATFEPARGDHTTINTINTK